MAIPFRTDLARRRASYRYERIATSMTVGSSRPSVKPLYITAEPFCPRYQ
ncbi:hypothetical protein HSR122_0124 [Halapricum desulfuricans]|uniref:Uncharacterized protein n=1 Tax=Halapricum desulfuricans TaxID=2841257 RepID=A0A897N3H9_9EURY|nr:hypothetical protein HSR122_0124 [Halapricum desulfuricans]